MFKRVLKWAASNALWSAVTSGTVMGSVLSVWARAKNAPGYVVLLVFVSGFVVSTFLPRAISEIRHRARHRGALPQGPSSWRLVRVIVLIPDARTSSEPNAWAEGLGKWDEFAVHNLWANRP